ELADREQRRRRFQVHELEPEARDRYWTEWRQVQARFVDQPQLALREADVLVTEVMRRRGYPMDDFEQAAADVSVDHPREAEEARMSRAEQEEREPGSRMDVLMTQDRERYGDRWEQIQSGFVDEPRKAVEEADRLLEEVVQQLTRMCADEREQLARRWSGDGTDTEAMRTTLQGYRRLFSFILR